MMPPLVILGVVLWTLSLVLHVSIPFRQFYIVRTSKGPADLTWLFLLHGIGGAGRPIALLITLFSLLNGSPAWMLWLVVAAVFDIIQGAVSFYTYRIKRDQ